VRGGIPRDVILEFGEAMHWR